MMIFAHITEFARDTARMQNGKIPTKKEEEAVLREMCGNIMTHIEEILTDERASFRPPLIRWTPSLTSLKNTRNNEADPTPRRMS